MTMATPERRDCAPTSSGANPSLDAPNRLHSAMMTVMMIEALTEWRDLGVE